MNKMFASFKLQNKNQNQKQQKSKNPPQHPFFKMMSLQSKAKTYKDLVWWF